MIPLQHFGDLDLTRLQLLQVIVEYESTSVQGALALDNIHFLPSTGCNQVTQPNVYLPIVAKDYSPPVIHPPFWDFESGTQGWTHYKTYTPTLAVIAVEPSSFRALSGTSSLAMIVNLIGGDESYGKGAAYIDTPLDLSCKPLSCWLYVPTCGLGDPDKPNSVRLFVKDENDELMFGEQMPVVRNRWFQVSLRPSPEDGFASHTIKRVGVQFESNSPKTTYRGKIYLDACGWQEIDPVGTWSACTP
jgi:hypothetical protein